MEELKEIFGDQSFNYEQLDQALKAKKITLVNGEGMIPQGDLAAKEAELAAANATIQTLQETVRGYDGKDPKKLEGDLEALQQKYTQDIAALQMDSALNLALLSAGAQDARAVKPFLQLEEIKLENGKLTGVESQLDSLKKEKAFLFQGAQKPTYTPPAGGAPNTVSDLKSALAEKYQAQ